MYSSIEVLFTQKEAVESIVTCTDCDHILGVHSRTGNNKDTWLFLGQDIYSLSCSFLTCKIGQIMPISKGYLGN